jgi:fructose-1,6-bisphosphatase
MSEERPYPTTLCKDGNYVVTFDPIDGSNIIDSNYTVGSIFGIWPNGDLNGRCGRSMVGAALAVYGSRTTIIVYNTNKNLVEEWTLRVDEHDKEYWTKTKERIKVSRTAKYFAPANSKAILDHIPYRKSIEFWSKSGYALRYSGAFSADTYHILSKGEGIYCSIGSKIMKRKLRILYECAPVAFLIENAGGVSSNGEIPILDVIIDGYY